MDRSKDWFSQAEHLLKQAKWSIKGDFFDGVCFLAQQSAEMAIKSLCLHFKLECWGHAISRLLPSLEEDISIPSTILDIGKKLDKYYIPTRYPNGFEIGAPKDYFTSQEAEEAIENAEEIIEFCRRNLPESR